MKLKGQVYYFLFIIALRSLCPPSTTLRTASVANIRAASIVDFLRICLIFRDIVRIILNEFVYRISFFEIKEGKRQNTD